MDNILVVQEALDKYFHLRLERGSFFNTNNVCVNILDDSGQALTECWHILNGVKLNVPKRADRKRIGNSRGYPRRPEPAKDRYHPFGVECRNLDLRGESSPSVRILSLIALNN